MTAADIAIAVLLSICVATTFISCWALVIFKDIFQRMHYLSVITTVSTLALLIAVVIKEGAGQAATKTILSFLILLLINAVLTHATARAARVRQYGNWTPTPDEHIEAADGGK